MIFSYVYECEDTGSDRGVATLVLLSSYIYEHLIDSFIMNYLISVDRRDLIDSMRLVKKSGHLTTFIAPIEMTVQIVYSTIEGMK